MPVTIGARFGPYEIIAPIGAGGMGEVYRARDSRLHRDVAIKVLPAALSADTDRLVRFEQEARAAAALNHPNILAVYDVGSEFGAPFIVSELLEGQTLRERLEAGPLPVRKAIAYVVCVTRGLEAAHGKGITHRDLKPDNVFVTTDDRIKILDFGLAKLAVDPSAAAASALQTAPPTAVGAVLGTVGYMAPEQVRGQAVDPRTDLFAVGVILYELLSGRRAFRRDTAPETMAAILNEDPPDIAAAGRSIPPALVRIIDRCLEKHPAARFQTASDLAFALESLSEASNSTNATAPSVRVDRVGRGWIGWVIAAVLLLALAPVAVRHLREQQTVARPMQFQFSPSVELAGPGNFSVSPDGGSVAFFGIGADGGWRLWVRAMNSLDVRPLPGTEIARGSPAPPPFWSPDNRFVAFQASDFKLKKVDVSGGPAQTLGEMPGVAVGGSWNSTGDIIVGNTAGGILRLSENGGAVSPVTVMDAAKKEEFHLLPTFLPDGRHFLYLRIAPGAMAASGTYIGTLDAKADAQSAERLAPYEVGMTYVPAIDQGPGRLMFVREGTLFAQPFDPVRLAMAGNPVAVAQGVGSFRDGGYFSASGNDVLVYRTANTDFQIASFDRTGGRQGRASEPAGFRGAALSPDGGRAVASRTVPQDATKADLWLFDLSQGNSTTRFTFGNGLAEYPIWSSDGRRIAFTLNNNRVVQKLASGDGDEQELLRSSPVGIVKATSWSADGRFVLYTIAEATATKTDIWVLPTGGGKPVPFARTQFEEDQGRFSPDGRWVAYVSDQSGLYEVYVRAFTTDFASGSAGTGASVLVSRGGGSEPRWRRDGRELFYLAQDGKMMAVPVAAAATFTVAAATALFQAPVGSIVGDVIADGSRFLLVTPVGPSASAPFTVVLNWSALKK